ncbi:MAG: hypothetical protein H6618_06360 [Deltaproteobacteria bacterium]|nr:hypothetical protein [Deltaproteobacteria bacterium]
MLFRISLIYFLFLSYLNSHAFASEDEIRIQRIKFIRMNIQKIEFRISKLEIEFAKVSQECNKLSDESDILLYEYARLDNAYTGAYGFKLNQEERDRLLPERNKISSQLINYQSKICHLCIKKGDIIKQINKNKSMLTSLKQQVVKHNNNLNEKEILDHICFVQGTKILLKNKDSSNTSVNIEELREGEKIWSCDASTSDCKEKEVLQIHLTEIPKGTALTKITVGDTSFVSTVDHPYYVNGRGKFTQASNLTTEDKLLNDQLKPVQITSVTHITADEDMHVYNLTVEGFNTFFIADNSDESSGYLVHNCEGAENFAEGLTESLQNSLTDLASVLAHPIDAIQNGATEAKNTILELPDAVKDGVERARELAKDTELLKEIIGDEISQLVDTWSGLSSEEKAREAGKLTGEVIASMASPGKAVMKAGGYLSKIAKSTKKGRQFNEALVRAKNRIDTAKHNNNGNSNSAPRSNGPVFKTTKEASTKAKELGFEKIKERVNGQPVYRKGKEYITRDVDGHNGGAWKKANSVKDLGKKETRSGTYDADLNRIGD